MSYLQKVVAAVGALLLLSILAAGSTPVSALDITKDVVDGVTLLQRINDNPEFPQLTNILTIDLSNPDLQMKAALGRGVIFTDDVFKGKENIASMVERTGAVAGVNADFFPMEWGADPLGICIVDGELVSEPNGYRAAFGLTKDNKPVFDIPVSRNTLLCGDGTLVKLDGINRPRGTGEIIAYTEAFGPLVKSKFPLSYVVCTAQGLPVTPNRPVQLTVLSVGSGVTQFETVKGGVVLAGGGASTAVLEKHAKVGDTLTMRFDIFGSEGCDWSEVVQAVGGGPWLVKDGEEFVDAAAQKFTGSLVSGAHPRSAIALTKDNKLLFVTVDGRQRISKGLTLRQFAAQLRRLGAVQAINLDGGGSTTLSIRGFVINSLSEWAERYVANGLLVFSRNFRTVNADTVSIAGLPESMLAGDFAYLSVVDSQNNSPLPEGELSKVIWGSKSGMGFVDQLGRYTPNQARKGKVCVAYGPLVSSHDVTICPAPTQKITAKIVPDSQYKYRAALQITARDKHSNPTPSRAIKLTVEGGTADNGTLLTDSGGKYSTGITLDDAITKCKVTIKIDAATEVVRFK